MDHPISALITRAGEQSQRSFAAAARHHVDTTERVSVEVAVEGLIVRGLTELDIETIFHELTRHFSNIKYSKPQVIYQMGPPLMEPYYRAIIDAPEECFGLVVADISDRRGMIQSIDDTATGKRIVATVPVSECFGYATVLRASTRGRGSHVVEFSHYEEVGGDSAA